MRIVLGFVLTALVLAGCGASPPASAPAVEASAAPSIAGSLPPDGAATPEPPPFASDEEILRAMESRQLFGLRSDEAWVRLVAVNPLARVFILDFPMMPEEEVEFQTWTDAYHRVAGAVQQYSEAHPEDFSGVYIDHPSRRVVALFTADLEAHRSGIEALIPGDAGTLDVRVADLSIDELQALLERIVEERDWLRTIDAAFVSGGVDEARNRVDLEISSANRAAAELIAAHFGVGPEVIHVTTDGTGIQLLPRGTVRGRVVRADGSPPGENGWSIAWTSDQPGAGSGDCGTEVGVGVAPDGRFSIPCAPGGWTILIQEADGDGSRDIGSGHVVVPPGLAVDVVITVEP
jgi:hypothetical protein